MKYKITPELARIVAHICGDGYIYTSKQRRCKSELLVHPRKNIFRKKYYVRYVNTEQVLAQQFIDDVKKQFNRSVTKLRRFEYEISGKNIYDLLRTLGAGKSRDWYISDEILNSSDKIKIEWIKAFFDDEAHIRKSSKAIIVSVINKNGLISINKILNNLNINSYINGPYYYTYNDKIGCKYYLNIRREAFDRYCNLIGFYHPKKSKKLKINYMGLLGISSKAL